MGHLKEGSGEDKAPRAMWPQGLRSAVCAGPDGGGENLKGAVAKAGSASESRKTLADALVFYQDCEGLQTTQAVARDSFLN